MSRYADHYKDAPFFKGTCEETEERRIALMETVDQRADGLFVVLAAATVVI